MTFNYTGTKAGVTNVVQAQALLTGMTTFSNTVRVQWNTGVNQAPVVSAGTAQTITLPAGASLSGSVSDDGLPVSSTLSIQWSKVSGPGDVTFDNPKSPTTAAAFSVSGVYVLAVERE